MFLFCVTDCNETMNRATNERTARGKSKYVGSGSYGCIMRPAIPCTVGGAEANPTVAKLFTDPSDAEEERVANGLVNMIDPDHSFTVSAIESCTVDAGMYDVEEIKKCGMAIDGNTSQIVYADAGISLADACDIFPFDVLFVDMYPVFYGLFVLQSKGFVHLDVKPANITYRPDLHQMYLIDFGTLIRSGDLQHGVCTPEMDHLLKHPYEYYPSEFQLTCRYRNSRKENINLGKARSVCMKNFDRASKIARDLMRHYKDHEPIRRTLENIASFDVQECLNGIRFPLTWKKVGYVNGIDPYSLGVTLLETLKDCMNSSPFDSSEPVVHLHHYVLDLVHSMTRKDFLRRYDCEQALSRYLEIREAFCDHYGHSKSFANMRSKKTVFPLSRKRMRT